MTMITFGSCSIVLEAEGALRSQQSAEPTVQQPPAFLVGAHLATHYSQSGRLDHRVVDPQATQTWASNVKSDAAD